LQLPLLTGSLWYQFSDEESKLALKRFEAQQRPG